MWCVQLTDEWVEIHFPGQETVQNFKQNLIDALKIKAESDTQEAVRFAITNVISDLVDAEIPEFMIEEVAKNEFQAKLLQVGQKVRFALVLSLHAVSHWLTTGGCQPIHRPK